MRPLSHQDILVPCSCSSKPKNGHSSTSFSVGIPRSCKLFLHGCRNVGDPKRAHASMHLIIPLRPRATTRPGHALRLVENKKKGGCANSFICTKTKLCNLKHIIKSYMLASQHKVDHHCRDGRGCIALGREKKRRISERKGIIVVFHNTVHLHVLTHIHCIRTSILQHIHWASCHCFGHHDIIEHHGIALDIMTLHWTSCYRFYFWLFISYLSQTKKCPELHRSRMHFLR